MSRSVDSVTSSREVQKAHGKAGGARDRNEPSRAAQKREDAVKVSISARARKAAEAAERAETEARLKSRSADAASFADK